MRTAFYAPLKPPSHPVPSGDRHISRLFIEALRLAGHEVRVVSNFRSYEGEGSRARQEEIRCAAAAEAKRLLSVTLEHWRPHLWFTYHLYQKAPDWLGPPIARTLGIPYIVAEATYAPSRATGRWDEGLNAVAEALGQADTVLLQNPNDEECVAPLLRKRDGAAHALHAHLDAPELAVWKARAEGRPAALEPMLPFLRVAPYTQAWRDRARHRAALAARHRIDPGTPWLLAVGMMRQGDKLASYRLLAESLVGLESEPWRLLVAGDGSARAEVSALFARFGDRVHWLGAQQHAALPPIYAACDLQVWPAINEAIGMAVLEAQAAGLPAVAANVGAIGTIVGDGAGALVPEGDAKAFRQAVAQILALPESERERMSRTAAAKAARFHDIAQAASLLDVVLRGAVARAGRRHG